MAWRHPADDLPAAHAHQPFTVFLVAGADGDTAEDVRPVEGDGPTLESEVRRRDSAAIRAGCSCGWRGSRLAINQQSSQHRAAKIDREVESLQRRRLQGDWEAHLREVVPTLALHLHMPHVRYLDAELGAAVAHARRHEASWAAIAEACSRPAAGVVMSRQAAHQRWARSSAGLDAPENRAAMPVVTGWPGAVGWTHPAAGVDAAAVHNHRPRTVWVERNGGEADHRTRTSTGLRPGCGCGWRGSPRPIPDELPYRVPDAVAALERGFGPEWGRHLYTAVATLRIREVLDLMAGVHADLDATVADARHGHASWQEIADVVGTRRQSAHQRWRHLDADPHTDSAPSQTAASRSQRHERVRKAPPLLRPAPRRAEP